MALLFYIMPDPNLAYICSFFDLPQANDTCNSNFYVIVLKPINSAVGIRFHLT